MNSTFVYNKIRILVMDVDGTLTDGGIYIGSKGEVMKKFNVKDGYAIRRMLPPLSIIPAVLTGRSSDIVIERCKELGISYIIQSSGDKVKDLVGLCKELGVSLQDIAYIGDDLNDLEAMKQVGLRGCPSDAADEIKNICEFVSVNTGGNGCVREFVEWIKDLNGKVYAKQVNC